MPRESEIISRIRRRARVTDRVATGIGDDAAVLRFDAGTDVVACCDLSVEGVHFRTEWAGPRLIGYKSLAVTLSDVAAMGGTARFAMVSVAFPHGATSEFIDELMDGVLEIADRSGVALVGGDTSTSPGPLFIDTIAIGECGRGKAVTRGGARPGDLIFVTGSLGASALGLKLLERGHRLQVESGDPESRARNEALLRHLAPEPRLEAGKAIGDGGLATAMIDISDGLSTDLWHILAESGRGAIIHADSIPIAECVKLLSSPPSSETARIAGGFDALGLALHGGEEFELLFTGDRERRAEVDELSAALGLPITAIGEIVEGDEAQLERGAREPLLPGGYEHEIGGAASASRSPESNGN